MGSTIGSIITDCSDHNAQSRQQLRFASLFGATSSFLGLRKHAPDLEAAGHLIDQLDILSRTPKSITQSQSVIILNVAPRGQAVKKNYPNGSPFCYVKVNQTYIISTYEGRSLSLLKQFNLADQVQVLDIPTVTAAAIGWGELTFEQSAAINNSQFRSLEFAPLAAYWLTHSFDVPSKPADIRALEESGLVWTIDNFGNVKTTLLPEDIDFADGKEIILSDGKPAICCTKLADVPDDITAITVGSSGYGSQRFLEIVVQWHDKGFSDSHSAHQRHNLKVGDPVLQSTTA